MTLDEATADDLLEELMSRYMTAVFCGTLIDESLDAMHLKVHGSIIHARGLMESAAESVVDEIHRRFEAYDNQQQNEDRPDDDDLA